ISEPILRASSAMSSIAPGTVMVISTMGMPPAQTASLACMASADDEARTTGTIPISRMRLRTCSLVLIIRWRSSCDARPHAAHILQDLFQRDHGGVAGRGHGKSAVCRSALHCPLQPLADKQAVDKTGGEGITAADAIEDFQIGTARGFTEQAIRPGNGSPVIA